MTSHPEPPSERQVLYALAPGIAASTWYFGPGVLVQILLWLAIVATLVLFWRVVPAAGGLLIPYLAWVSFATVLNASLWWLNRPAVG